jgi:hypothetical protein
MKAVPKAPWSACGSTPPWNKAEYLSITSRIQDEGGARPHALQGASRSGLSSYLRVCLVRSGDIRRTVHFPGHGFR